MLEHDKKANVKGKRMKLNKLVLAGVLAGIISVCCYEISRAGADGQGGGIRIGVVSIRRIFRGSKRVAEYEQNAISERQQVEARLEKLDKEIQAGRAGLKTLVRSSSDYVTQLKEILHKQAELSTEQEFYKQRTAALKQRMTERLYRDILQATEQVAKEKGLDLVFEQSEPEFPAASPTQLELTLGMHKVLYSGGCVDITAEVTAKVDVQGADR
jgi:Skp family chaperone for outer membrane proteins